MDTFISLVLTDDLPKPYIKFHLLRHLPGFRMELHSHSFSHLITVLAGELEITFLGNTYALHKGQSVLLPAGIPHSLASKTGYSQLGIDIAEPDSSSDHTDKRNIRKILSNTFPNGFGISTLLCIPCAFDDIYNIMHNLDEFTRLKLINRVDSIVVSFIESSNTLKSNSYIDDFLKLISSPNGYDYSLPEICERLNISKTHLERLVQEKFGCSAIEYCKRMKIINACALLLDTQLSISQIAEQLHFGSAAHFSYFFKSRMGINPKDYRRNDVRKFSPSSKQESDEK